MPSLPGTIFTLRKSVPGKLGTYGSFFVAFRTLLHPPESVPSELGTYQADCSGAWVSDHQSTAMPASFHSASA